MRTLITGLLMALLLAGCSAAQIQNAADALNAMEQSVCGQMPMAVVASKVAQAGTVELQKQKPGEDADRAVASANLALAATEHMQAYCLAKGYK